MVQFRGIFFSLIDDAAGIDETSFSSDFYQEVALCTYRRTVARTTVFTTARGRKMQWAK
jgi:hypothetical protein